MTKSHGKKRDKEEVKDRIAIAMERAEAMARGEAGRHRAEEGGEEVVTIRRSELESLREKAARAEEYHEALLRKAADLENYKKRVEREKQDLIKYGQEQLMSDLLRVLDNFERAMAAGSGSGQNAGIMEGVKLIQRQLLDILKKNGLEQINAVGTQFDPGLHEAISQVETDDYPEGTVIGEQLKGYTLNGRLLRPSAVTVAKAPARRGE